MSLNVNNARVQFKYSTISGVTPTIAPSTDHTDGTWSATDLYVGEFFANVADNKFWLRTLTGIVPITSGTTTIDISNFLALSGGTITGTLNAPEVIASYFSGNTIYGNIISGGTFYGDGSNLTNLPTTTWTGGTITGPAIFNDTVDLCGADVTVSQLTGCGGEIQFLSDISGLNISATTFYGDGSQLTGIVADNLVTDTYASISGLKSANLLTKGAYYYISDKNILTLASDTNLFEPKSIKIQKIIKSDIYSGVVPSGYSVNQGTWNSTTFFNDGDFCIWGGQVYQYSGGTGNTMALIDDFSLQTDAYVTVIPQNNTDFYENNAFDVIYDFDLDKVYEQSDKKGNKVILNESLVDLTAYCDWGNPYIVNNICAGFYNNANLDASRLIRYNEMTEVIANNTSLGGQIQYNKGRSIKNNKYSSDIAFNNVQNIQGNVIDQIMYNDVKTNILNNNSSRITRNKAYLIMGNTSNINMIIENICSGEIKNNSNTGMIGYNSCANINNNSNQGDITYNKAITISYNINEGPISNNEFQDGCYSNSNTGDISFNICGTIQSNSNNGTIIGNKCGSIDSNSNTHPTAYMGFINYNQCGMNIYLNTNAGYIQQNTINQGITENSNNGNIENNIASIINLNA